MHDTKPSPSSISLLTVLSRSTTLLLLTLPAIAQANVEPDFRLTAAPLNSYTNGTSIAGGKDVNGDGIPDVVIGAADNYSAASTSIRPGAVYVFSGASQALLDIAYGAADGDRFGWSVDLIDDVNGDGCADILVGAPGFNPTAARADAGAFYLLSGLTRQILHRLDGNLAGDQFGFCVANTRDIDGNGMQDFVVGSPYGDVNGAVDKGQVHFFNVLPGGTNSGILSWGAGNAAGDLFGWKVAAVGDVNGDGLKDWAASSPMEDYPFTNCGQFHVYFGPIGVGGASHIAGAMADARFGTSFAAVDVDGDGDSEVVVGAPGHLGGRGRISVLQGTALAETPVALGAATTDSLGYQVGNVGDSNGDGLEDFAYTRGGVGQAQLVQVVGGSTAGVFVTSCTLFNSVSFTGNLMFSGVRGITHAGDIDGDGLVEILVGTPHFAAVLSNSNLQSPPQVASTSASDTLCDRVLVTWPRVPGNVRYRISRSGVVIGETPVNASQFVDSNPSVGARPYSVMAFVGPSSGGPSTMNTGTAFRCFQPFGAPCVGTAGWPTISRVHDPEIGNPFQQRAGSLLPGQIVVWILGMSQTSAGGQSLPLSLSGLGFTGCQLLVSLDALTAAVIGGDGTHTFQMQLANDPGLLGLHFFTQAMAVDPQANPGGLVFSAAADNVVSSPW
ncbi:MAG: FG-GAP repeat protein [Planctomycetes bacterium]|nr:FG-GAP repeat protein [Planctomycetota bacterium]